jgi:hypothetical protein
MILWKNIFININNSGIIIQDIKLEVKKEIVRETWIQKYFFGKKDECIKIWNNLLKD